MSASYPAERGLRLLKVIPIGLFVLSTANTFQSHSSPTALTLARGQFEQLPRAYRSVGGHLALFELPTPKSVSDRFTDYHATKVFQPIHCEMTGRLFRPNNLVGRDFPTSDFAPFQDFRQDSGIAMINENVSARGLQTPMPAGQMFRGNAVEIRSLVSMRITNFDEVLLNDQVVGFT